MLAEVSLEIKGGNGIWHAIQFLDYWAYYQFQLKLLHAGCCFIYHVHCNYECENMKFKLQKIEENIFGVMLIYIRRFARVKL
jgi:hypothetical protein